MGEGAGVEAVMTGSSLAARRQERGRGQWRDVREVPSVLANGLSEIDVDSIW